MTTYVLGAGASLHAGYPLCSALWSKMAMWVIQSQTHDSEYRRAVDTITTVYGPVEDVEELFTKLDLRQGAFNALTEDQRTKLKGALQRCIREYFKVICDQHLEAPLYQAFANVVRQGDCIVTFNYDVALENALIAVQKFRVKNGYGANFQAAWDEPDSEVTLLKLHGSINWIALLFGGSTSVSATSRTLWGRDHSSTISIPSCSDIPPKYSTQVLRAEVWQVEQYLSCCRLMRRNTQWKLRWVMNGKPSTMNCGPKRLAS